MFYLLSHNEKIDKPGRADLSYQKRATGIIEEPVEPTLAYPGFGFNRRLAAITM